MTDQTLSQALTLTDDGAGALTALLSPDFSNAAQARDPLRGAPFGGLMAALAAGAARQALDITTPLQTLTVQYLAAARFAPIAFEATLLRGGRSVSYASVAGGQPDRPAIHALATFGAVIEAPSVKPLQTTATPVADLDDHPMDPGFAPWFTRHIQHRFEAIPSFGGAPLDRPQLRLWMRAVDGLPLDEARLCFLLDGIFPTYMTVLPPPPLISATVDLRYDLLTPLNDDVSPEGWAAFEFQVQDVGGGWAVDDGVAFAPDGRPLALVRQRRKLALRG